MNSTHEVFGKLYVSDDGRSEPGYFGIGGVLKVRAEANLEPSSSRLALRRPADGLLEEKPFAPSGGPLRGPCVVAPHLHTLRLPPGRHELTWLVGQRVIDRVEVDVPPSRVLALGGVLPWIAPIDEDLRRGRVGVPGEPDLIVRYLEGAVSPSWLGALLEVDGRSFSNRTAIWDSMDRPPGTLVARTFSLETFVPELAPGRHRLALTVGGARSSPIEVVA